MWWETCVFGTFANVSKTVLHSNSLASSMYAWHLTLSSWIERIFSIRKPSPKCRCSTQRNCYISARWIFQEWFWWKWHGYIEIDFEDRWNSQWNHQHEIDCGLFCSLFTWMMKVADAGKKPKLKIQWIQVKFIQFFFCNISRSLSFVRCTFGEICPQFYWINIFRACWAQKENWSFAYQISSFIA